MKLSKLPAVLMGSSVSLCSATLQKPLDASSSQFSNTALHDASSAPFYREALVSLHKSLVSNPSVTGNENEVGSLLVDYLTSQGLHAELQFVPPLTNSSSDQKPRFNVLAWPGSATRNPSPKVLLSSHIDTVPPFIPYSTSDDIVSADTVIAGRGSVDAKASVAAQVIALLELLASPDAAIKAKAEDVVLLYVVGEEVDGIGMRYFSDTLDIMTPPLSFKAGIFGEPTEGKLACGHKGHLGCTLTAHGKAGHSGYPWLGKSATEVLMRALVKVLDTDLGSSERFRNTTVNVGHIEGGIAANVIPEKAEANLAVRVAVGPQSEGASIVEGRLREVLKSVDEDIEMSCANGYGAVICDCEVDGFQNATMNYGTDVPNLKGNHTRYLYGPGTILVAHGPDEALKLKDLEAAVEGFKKLILHALDS